MFIIMLFTGDGDDDTLLADSEEKEEKASLSKGERSHLIVWEVSSPEWFLFSNLDLKTIWLRVKRRETVKKET